MGMSCPSDVGLFTQALLCTILGCYVRMEWGSARIILPPFRDDKEMQPDRVSALLFFFWLVGSDPADLFSSGLVSTDSTIPLRPKQPRQELFKTKQQYAFKSRTFALLGTTDPLIGDPSGTYFGTTS